MDKPELDAMVEEAAIMWRAWEDDKNILPECVLRDLVSKVEFRTAKRFADCEVPCPEQCCNDGIYWWTRPEGGPTSNPHALCKGTGTVPLHVRDRWVAEQCAEFVEDRESKHDHSDDNREDLTRYLQGSHDGRKLAANRIRTFADGRFSENAHD